MKSLKKSRQPKPARKMKMNSKKKLMTWLFNPFTYTAGWPALLMGLTVILLTGFIGSLSNTHFDGILDVHSGRPAPLWFFMITGLMNWLCMSVVIWLIGKITSKNTFRTIDVFGTQALARWPSLLTALGCLTPAYTRFTQTLIQFSRTQQFPENINPTDAVIFGCVLLLSISALCWMVRLMYMSYKVSCDPAEKRAMKAFIVGLIIAEIMSKVSFWFLAETL